MSLREETELLRGLPLFAHVDPVRLKLIAFTSERLVFEAGQNLCVQGEPGDAAYLILEGEAEVLVETPRGPLHVSTVGKADIVGEIAILCDVPRTATVCASSRVDTLRIGKEEFFQLLQNFPEVSVPLLKELASRLENTTAKLREVSVARGL